MQPHKLIVTTTMSMCTKMANKVGKKQEALFLMSVPFNYSTGLVGIAITIPTQLYQAFYKCLRKSGPPDIMHSSARIPIILKN